LISVLKLSASTLLARDATGIPTEFQDAGIDDFTIYRPMQLVKQKPFVSTFCLGPVDIWFFAG